MSRKILDLSLRECISSGISQVPLLLSVHKIQNMKVDVFDGKGATPLCIVAEAGVEAMADVGRIGACVYLDYVLPPGLVCRF